MIISDETWYKDAVIYEVHIRAFRDSNGDGIGDITGLIEKLDYIARVGVTTIWLLPFYPSPLRDDGYDVADYRGVHPAYGRVADVRRLVREAHRYGLRVITELVCNHTSDQHPWFQRARRSRPGTSLRDFYIWSDTDQRYPDARIIFRDFETSNWTRDPVARAYFWHRFYSHQPDLNYDNPQVWRAIFGVVDYWLEMGVDGLRLDAIPYLYKRDGTDCENLPENHAFLKALRAHIDSRFNNRILLAEANQWPEDAAAYFGGGEGDECHMAFHFPLMPRLFIALRLEDGFPIMDILTQTPSIPERGQWAIFLRNHDELTLEMVTDEEREYMYRAYTQGPEARLNLGIRRRLAPLLNNDRRRIELMNALLFSLPGTPIIYYGDEIGMGDNIHLGDRDGVRTPMQWSADRNAGFSSANSQRLYLPVITDPEYHYTTVNVEAQEQNPRSLLNWTRQLILLRRRQLSLSRGRLEFVNTDNGRVLAFSRQLGDERILVVANLSRFAQSACLDLSSHKGLAPLELFGHNEFPEIQSPRYPLSLGPHDFYWFTLEPPRIRKRLDEQPHQLSLEDSALEQALPWYLTGQHWFSGKGRVINNTEVVDTVFIDDCQLKLIEVHYREGEPESFALPLARGTDTTVVDAQSQSEFNIEILKAMAGRCRLNARHGEVIPVSTRRLRELWSEGVSLGPQRLVAEQTNSSLVFGDQLVMKLFRRVGPGINPDFEVSRLLESARFSKTAPVLGALLYSRPNMEPIVLAMLRTYVRNEGSAWAHAHRVLTSLEHDPIERYLPFAALLGKCTAEMHLALASASHPDFAPERTLPGDRRSVYQSIHNLMKKTLRQLSRTLDDLIGVERRLAEDVLASASRLEQRLRGLLNYSIRAKRIRCHGDYNLGQLLLTQGDFLIMDFEGEPSRPLPERRAKRWVTKDIVSIVGSLEHVALTSGVQQGARWAQAVGTELQSAYWDTVGEAAFVPSLGERQFLTEMMEIEWALLELQYKLLYRPELTLVPLQRLNRLSKMS